MKNFQFSRLSGRALLASLYATQGLLLLAACILLAFQGDRARLLLAPPHGIAPWISAALFAAAAFAANLLLERYAPRRAVHDPLAWRLFRRMPAWHILLACFVVAFSEELLFRGAVQHWLGVIGTSILFSLLHARYLKHWLPAAFVFCVSCGLGWLLERTGTLWMPVAAHFWFDAAAGFIIRYRRHEESEGETGP